MKVKLYGSPMCSRCKSAKMMLDKRKIKYEYVEILNQESFIVNDISVEDLPLLIIDGMTYTAKDSLLKIRELKRL